MKILRLAADADLSVALLEAAVDLLNAAGEDKPYLQLIVSPGSVAEARRLLSHIEEHRPGLMALCAKAGSVTGNYLWDDADCRKRWLVVGKHCMLYSAGGA